MLVVSGSLCLALYFHQLIVLRLQHPDGSVETGNSSASFTNPFMHRSWSEMAARTLGAAVDAAEQAELKTLWLHVGYINLTTWNLSLLSLFPASDSEDCPQGCRKLVVGQPCKAAESISFFSGAVDFNVRWKVTVYTILSDDRILSLPEMVPNWIYVKELQALPASIFWQGWQTEEQEFANAQADHGKRRKRKADRAAKPAAKRGRGLLGREDAAAGAATATEGDTEYDADQVEESDAVFRADLATDEQNMSLRLDDENLDNLFMDLDTKSNTESEQSLPDDPVELQRRLEELFDADDEAPPGGEGGPPASQPRPAREPASGSGREAPPVPEERLPFPGATADQLRLHRSSGIMHKLRNEVHFYCGRKCSDHYRRIAEADLVDPSTCFQCYKSQESA